jgi:hypothetical protein
MIRFLMLLLLSLATSATAQSSQAADNANPRLTPQLTLSQVHQLHSTVFEQRFRRNLLELSKRQGDVRIRMDVDAPFFANGQAPSPGDLIRESACRADAVVIASIKQAESFLTQDKEWVFTDNVVTLNRVLKDNTAHPLAFGSMIVVARSGGHIATADGHIIEVIDGYSPALQIGKSYLLFLRYVPASGQYVSADGDDSFSVQGSSAIPLVSEPPSTAATRTYELQTLSELIQTGAACRKKGSE